MALSRAGSISCPAQASTLSARLKKTRYWVSVGIGWYPIPSVLGYHCLWYLMPPGGADMVAHHSAASRTTNKDASSRRVEHRPRAQAANRHLPRKGRSRQALLHCPGVLGSHLPKMPYCMQPMPFLLLLLSLLLLFLGLLGCSGHANNEVLHCHTLCCHILQEGLLLLSHHSLIVPPVSCHQLC